MNQIDDEELYRIYNEAILKHMDDHPFNYADSYKESQTRMKKASLAGLRAVFEYALKLGIDKSEQEQCAYLDSFDEQNKV